MNNFPIGVFDSGIGGLTVAKAITEQLPNETIIYFGDTAHMPYGDKSKELIRNYSIKITNFLLREKKCKAIVIACNTASAAAYEELRDNFKNIIPIINVIDPMIEEVIADNALSKVGIIGTKTTIQSGIYQEKLTRRKPSLPFAAMATPLLATMIEEGFYNDNISHAILTEYLNAPDLKGIDGIVLACTHYPLIKKEIDQYYKGKVKIFDSAQVVAGKLKWILEKEGLAHDNSRPNPNEFFISDYTASFKIATKIFFESEVQLTQIDLE
ncbi:MAG: glutamate racemase [Chitinophagales bacterium]|nr:glutamate racemase [Chitinophagales bacterium]